MEYSKGEWEVTKWASHNDIHISVKDTSCEAYKFIANCGNPKPDSLPTNSEAEANANLICAAVNACIKVNPDNPQGAAEAIKDMYEALKAMLVGSEIADDGRVVVRHTPSSESIINGFNALAKAEGK